MTEPIAWSDDPIESELQIKSELDAMITLVNKNLKKAGYKTLDISGEEN